MLVTVVNFLCVLGGFFKTRSHLKKLPDLISFCSEILCRGRSVVDFGSGDLERGIIPLWRRVSYKLIFSARNNST